MTRCAARGFGLKTVTDVRRETSGGFNHRVRTSLGPPRYPLSLNPRGLASENTRGNTRQKGDQKQLNTTEDTRADRALH